MVWSKREQKGQHSVNMGCADRYDLPFVVAAFVVRVEEVDRYPYAVRRLRFLELALAAGSRYSMSASYCVAQAKVQTADEVTVHLVHPCRGQDRLLLGKFAIDLGLGVAR